MVSTATASQSGQTSMNITREDIQLLVREPSAAMRCRIAQKITTGYTSGNFTESEINLANEIFRLLLKDTEVRVRKLLAEELKNALGAPHDIIWALANDHHEVATPVLQYSYVLTEEDLAQIVFATKEHPKLRAIASRESISKDLSRALVGKGDHEITKQVLSNKGASLNEATLETVLEDFSRDNKVLEELVCRGGLPAAFAEKLFAQVSDGLKKQLTKKYRLNKHVVEDVAESAKETALLQFISPWMSQQDINQLVDQMHKNNRLGDSVIIRSLCIGDLRFFETAIAKRVGIPTSNTRILLLDPGALGFRALYEGADLPSSFYPAVSTMLRIALEETEYGNYRADDFCERMIHRIRKQGYDQSIEHMTALMTMVGAAKAQPTLH